MLKAGVGISRDKRGRAAAFEAASRAMARAGEERPAVCLCFTTVDHLPDLRALLFAVREITHAPHVVGCAGAGIVSTESEIEGESAVGVLVASGGELRAQPFLLPEVGDLDRRVGSALEGLDPKLLLLLLGAFGAKPTELLGRVAAAAGQLPIIGGGAVGDARGGLVWVDDEVLPAGAAGLAIGGPVFVAVGVSHGCRPVGHLMTITRARGNLIFELDGMPAFEPFARLCREPLLADLRRAASFVFAGLPTGSGGRADYLVRSFVGFDPGAGVLAISEPVREGQALIFCVREAQGARRDLETMLEEVRGKLHGARPGFGLYIDCAGRGSGLYGVADHDIAFIRRSLGEFPLLGFFSSAEIAPLLPAPALEMYTGVLAVFAEVAQA